MNAAAARGHRDASYFSDDAWAIAGDCLDHHRGRDRAGVDRDVVFVRRSGGEGGFGLEAARL